MSQIMGNPYFVYVDSRKRISGTDSNFTYNIAFPDDHNYDRVVVLDALIPKSYYLIQAGYNTFQLKENATIVTITVPIGSYLLKTFQTVVGGLLTSSSPNSLTYTITYPASTGPDTGMFTYTQTNGAIVSSLIFNTTLFEPFGFLSGSTNVFTGTTLVSTCVIKLQSEDRLLIHSNIVNNPNRDDILVSINAATNVNYSSIQYINYSPEYSSKVLSSDNNSTYNFSLTDENNLLLSTNGLNLNFTLMFYKKDPIFQQLRDFIKLLINKKE